jgi:O-antigen/teichoic acid export membrane protein
LPDYDAFSNIEEEYLRFRFLMQALILGAIVIVLAVAVLGVVDNWSDWVVLGVIVGTVIAVAFTVMNRQYPTRKRRFTRDSDSNW